MSTSSSSSSFPEVVRFVTYRHKKDNQPRRQEWPREDFLAFFADHDRTKCNPCVGSECPQKNGLAFSPGIVRPNSTRAKQNVEEVTFAVFDIDHATQKEVDALGERLEGYEVILYSTHSHRAPDDQCLRLIMPLTRPVKNIEWPRFWLEATRWLGIATLDESAKDSSRIYFVPTAPEGAKTIAIHELGRPIDVEQVLATAGSCAEPAVARADVAPQTPAPRRPTVDQFNGACAYLAQAEPAVSGKGGHPQTFKVALNVVRGFDLDQEVAYTLLSAIYNPRCVPPWSEEELRHKVADAAKSTTGFRGYMLRTGGDAVADLLRKRRERIAAKKKAAPADTDVPGPGVETRDEEADATAGAGDHSAGLDEEALVAEALQAVNGQPLTWATLEYLGFRLENVDDGTMLAAGNEFVAAARAALLARNPPAPLVERLIQQRLNGLEPVGPLRLHFSELDFGLRIEDAQGRVTPISTKSETLSLGAHRHEWAGTDAWTLKQGNDDEWEIGPSPAGASLFNKALLGHRGCLAALGIPLVRDYSLPLAHVEEQWEIEPETRIITAVRPYVWKSANGARHNAVEFFMKLHREGRLPLASENDVLLLVMALASPLLRHIGQGQLGVYWFTGPSGAGKDYLAEALSAAWAKINPAVARVKFELGLAGELELKRSFAMASGCIYARAKEVGKYPGMINLLIRCGGTDVVGARGLNKDEVNIPNVFTYLADSVEDMPERKEVSRRTVLIQASEIDDAIAKGKVVQEIQAAASGLILDLKMQVESKPADWYRNQANTRSRPLIPVALANLLGAKLPEVKGRNLDDLFEALYAHTQSAAAEGERERQAARIAKDGKEALAFPSYRFSHFFDSMKLKANPGEALRGYTSGHDIETWIRRETQYATVEQGRLPYLAVTIGELECAFRFVKGKRNFILVSQDEFHRVMRSSP